MSRAVPAGGVLLGLAGCVVVDPNAQLCAFGAQGCACTQGGGCDPGLACIDAVCVVPGSGSESSFTTAPGESGTSDTTSASSADTSSTDDGSESTTGGIVGPNLVFVTSTTYSAGSIGGLDGADAICQARADAAGHPGTFRAWLSIPGTHARDRFADARGWVRPDGLPFAVDVEELSAGRMFYPALLDENGTEIPINTPMWTGTNPDGTAGDPEGNMMCGQWNDDGASYALAGTVGSGQVWWTTAFQLACSEAARLHCMAIDAQYDLVVEPMPGRLVFGSSGAIMADAGRGAADALCQAEAEAAGRTGSFLALMAMPDEAAADRLDLGGPPWVRADGIPIFRVGQTMGDLLATPVSRDADDNVIPYAIVWAGMGQPTIAGTPENTCMGWTTTTGNTSLATVFDIGWHGWSLGGVGEECADLRGVLCFEE